MCADKDDVRMQLRMVEGEVRTFPMHSMHIKTVCPWVSYKHFPQLLIIKTASGTSVSFFPRAQKVERETLIAHYIANKCFKIS